MSAPRSISMSTTGTWPSAAAHISADWPFQVSRALTSAPASSSSRMASTCPERATNSNGVSPAFTACAGLLGSTPAASNWAMMAAPPFLAASAKGVTP